MTSNTNMRAIPSMYFRPPSPYKSRASTSHPAVPMSTLPIQLQVPSARSSASSAASYRSEKVSDRDKDTEKEKEREKRTPMAPAMRRADSSSSSSGSSRGYAPTASYYYRQNPSPQLQRRTLTKATAPSSSLPSSRTRSRRQSVSRGSNPYPASRTERPANASYDVDSNSISHLREALGSIESQMANLQLERQKLETRLEHAVRQQSPVNLLPRELLGSIFEIGVHRAEAEDAVLLSTLMRVCKSWTDVALNTPGLWSRILIDSPASLPKARRKLARSRAVPLDITIQFGPTMDPEEDVPLRGGQGGHRQAVIETVVHAMDLLQPALWRWRSFRLAVPTHAHAAAALSQCIESAPLLEVLAVQVHHVMADSSSRAQHRHAPLSLNAFMDEDAGVQLFGGEVPRLRACSLSSFDAGWGGPVMRGLTVLRLGGFWNGAAPSIRTLVEVLRACPAIEELVLRNMSDVEGDASNESCACNDFDNPLKSKHSHSHSHSHTRTHTRSVYPRESDMVHLPRLKSALFYYSGALRTTGLLAQLSFPSLERLEFSYIDNLTPALTHLKRQACSPGAEWTRFDDFEEMGGGIRRMQMRTGLPLRALRIESCLFNELKLVRLLRRLPTLQTLELVEVEDVSASFLNGLSTPQPGHEWICPQLETLSFDGCSALPWDALRTLVEARLPAADSAGARLLGPSRASRSTASLSSSASAYAAAQQRTPSSSAPSSSTFSSSREGRESENECRRLRVMDLTRCAQISKEMIAWLRMYVDEVRVRREAEQTYWGEFGFFAV